MDTVFFKHRYITQPSVTPADTLKKAINDLAAALKGKKNVDGTLEIEALTKLDELLNHQQQEPPLTQTDVNNVPQPNVPSQRDTADPKVEEQRPSHPTIMPQPRVENKCDATAPQWTKEARTTPLAPKMKLRSGISNNRNGRARIQQRQQLNSRQPPRM